MNLAIDPIPAITAAINLMTELVRQDTLLLNSASPETREATEKWIQERREMVLIFVRPVMTMAERLQALINPGLRVVTDEPIKADTHIAGPSPFGGPHR